jgi:molybdopterin molybdotransferase
VISLDQALAHYLSELPLLAASRQPLENVLGSVLAEAACAAVDLPLFTQSAVDGYALDHRDAAAALRLVGEVAAGASVLPSIDRGEAVRIYTGGALPPGADCVARQEIVDVEDGRICIRKLLAVHADTRLRGEELGAGALLAPAGTRLTPGLIAALAMAGVGEIMTRPPPRVRVLVTGDEVIPPGGTLTAGRIFDANGPLLRSWFHGRGVAVDVVHVADTLTALREALELALAEADLVITTGGVSVGDRDYVREAAAGLGTREVFWRVAQKPGMPLYFGMREHCAIIGLPGNPGAVMVGLHVHVERVMALMQGERDPLPHWRAGRLAAAVRGDGKRELLMRMRLQHDAAGAAQLQPLDRQGSHMLSNLVEANALVRINAPALSAGETVEWIPLT